MEKDIFKIVIRLKDALGLRNEKELSAAMGMNVGALRNHKTRRTIPYAQISELCERMGFSMDWVLTGEGPRTKADIARMDSPVPLRGTTFGERLRSLRETVLQAGPEEFIYALDITRDELEKLERGKSQPDGRFLTLLHSKYYGRVDLNYLLTGKPNLYLPRGAEQTGEVSEGAPAYDDALMKEVIEALEAIIREEGLMLTPEKRAELITLAYEHVREDNSKKDIKEKLLRFVRLVG